MSASAMQGGHNYSNRILLADTAVQFMSVYSF